MLALITSLFFFTCYGILTFTQDIRHVIRRRYRRWRRAHR